MYNIKTAGILRKADPFGGGVSETCSSFILFVMNVPLLAVRNRSH